MIAPFLGGFVLVIAFVLLIAAAVTWTAKLPSTVSLCLALLAAFWGLIICKNIRT